MDAIALPIPRTVRTWHHGVEPEVTEEQQQRIEDAICDGMQLGCWYADDRSREVCLTQFADPFAHLTRWAVETWCGSRKETIDWPSEIDARLYASSKRAELGV